MDLHLDAVGGFLLREIQEDLGGSGMVYTVYPLWFAHSGLRHLCLLWADGLVFFLVLASCGRLVILLMWHWFLEQRWVLANGIAAGDSCRRLIEGHVGPGGEAG